MTKAATELLEEYVSMLDEFIGERTEIALERAYQFGRMALSRQLSLLDLSGLHHSALAVILQKNGKENGDHCIQHSGDFFAEVVSPFEMALRGFLEANSELIAANQQLRVLTDELGTARDQALSASRFKSEFLANMSHEIRTPMNGILGMTEILMRSSLNERERQHVSTISDAGKALLSIINDILDFSKIEAGKLVLEYVEFQPTRLVESVAELLAGEARKKNLSLLTFIDPLIPVLLRSDAARTRQILTNFASNAIKFSDSGEVLIRAALVEKNDKIAKVKFSVTDTGIGLSDDEVNQLFQPFVQLDSSTLKKQGGTGLGLSISKRLVELLDGEIGVHSVKGHGSVFWFTLDLEIGGHGELRAAAPADLQGIRVLIVDDEQSSQDILHDYVTSWGMRNGRASSAQDALKILTKSAANDPYKVAIIDLFMPEMDGLKLGKVIRESDELKDLRLILVTAFDSPGTGEQAISLGFDAFLTKPIKQSQLLDCLSTVVRDKIIPLPKDPDEAVLAVKRGPAVKRKEMVLVAEDHPVNQEVALLLLKELGIECQIANNGKRVLELIERIPYSLIFMDCQMPEMDGFEACRAIRKLETRTGKHIPIVAMTAHAIEGSREQCFAAGMDDYISKPIEFEQLRSILDKWLPPSESQESSDASSSIAFEFSIADGGANLPMDFDWMCKQWTEPIARDVLAAYIKQSSSDISTLAKAVSAQDKKEVLSQAHQLTSTFKSLRAQSLATIASQLEDAAQRDDWAFIASLLQEVESRVSELNEFVSKLLAD